MKLRDKYLDGAKKMEKITKGTWIDVYAYEDVFVPVGQRKMINLGFALELPQGWEGHLAPRSSTFKTWGIIQTNSVGVVDDTYIGDNDIWHMPVYCLQGKDKRDYSFPFYEIYFERMEYLNFIFSNTYNKNIIYLNRKKELVDDYYLNKYDKNEEYYNIITSSKSGK